MTTSRRRFGKRECAMTTGPGGWVSPCATCSCADATSCSSTAVEKSRRRVSDSSRDSASISRRRAAANVTTAAVASTGPSDATTSPAPWAPRWPRRSSRVAWSSASPIVEPLPSRRSAERRSRPWAWPSTDRPRLASPARASGSAPPTCQAHHHGAAKQEEDRDGWQRINHGGGHHGVPWRVGVIEQLGLHDGRGHVLFRREKRELIDIVVPDEHERIGRERGDQHGKDHRREPDVEAVGELPPEVFEIAGVLRQNHAEALERRCRGPEVAAELDLAFLGIERDQQHGVDGDQRPDQQHDAEHHRARFRDEPPESHSCTTLVWSARISAITSGTSSGRTEIAAATPSAGFAAPKA